MKRIYGVALLWTILFPLSVWAKEPLRFIDGVVVKVVDGHTITVESANAAWSPGGTEVQPAVDSEYDTQLPLLVAVGPHAIFERTEHLSALLALNVVPK